jgi:hypothetical protein
MPTPKIDIFLGKVVEAGSADNTTMKRISDSTYSTVQDMQNQFHSAGVVSGGLITDAGTGTVSVSAGTGFIRSVNSVVADILFTDWAIGTGGNVTLVNTALNFIYVEYNGGSPQVIATDVKRTDLHTNILLGTVYRDALEVHITTESRIQVADHAGLMTQRLISTNPFARESGGIISSPSGRTLAVTAGSFWYGFIRFATTLFDSSAAGVFDTYYHDVFDATGWRQDASETDINNTQYDNGTAKATLTDGNYGIHWVYLDVDGEVYTVLGTGDYTLEEAQNAPLLSEVPPFFEGHNTLIGKMIILKNASTPILVQSTYGEVFAGSTPSSHSNLLGLGDDDHPQYLPTDGSRNMAGNFTIEGQARSDEQTTLVPAGAVQAIDWNGGNSVTVDLGSATGDVTLSFSNPEKGASYLIKFIQGATFRDVILPATAKMPGGSAPSTLDITEVDDAEDILTLYYDGTNYLAQWASNFG